MKDRREPQGLHFYCRRTGTHVLFDEIKIPPAEYSLGPRSVSIAITDKCDFSCSYCYVNLKDQYLPKEKIIAYCKELDMLGTFDVAFGGGEPTLHPDLIEICKTIWEKTGLGISITTHGHNLTTEFIQAVKNYISFIRVSIDGVEPIYSKFRKRPLNNLLPKLKLLSGQIPFGINTVVNRITLKNINSIKELFIEYGSFELLLLPMWDKGKFVLTIEEWDFLNQWILENYKIIPIRISSEAKPFLQLPFLFNNEEWDNDYGFIGIDSTFRKNSFIKEGLPVENFPSMKDLFIQWRNVGKYDGVTRA